MSGIALTIDAKDLDVLGAKAKAIEAKVTSQDLLEIAGRSMQQTLMQHFSELALDQTHHRTALGFGVSPSGFYEDAARQTQAPEIQGSDTVSVSITKEGVAQRRFGGTILGKPWLTIPARSEAYGRRAREFTNLRFVLFREDLAGLVEDNKSAGIKGQGGRTRGLSDDPAAGGLLFYWLVRQVTQTPDPSVLPTDEEILDPAKEAMRAEIAASIETAGGKGATP